MFRETFRTAHGKVSRFETPEHVTPRNQSHLGGLYLCRPGAAEGPSPVSGEPVSCQASLGWGAALHRPLSEPGPREPWLWEQGAWIFTFYGERVTPDFISGHQIRSPRSRTARRLSETLLFFPLPFPFPFSPLLFSPPPAAFPRQDAVCAPSRSSAWPPGGAPPPAACAPRAAGPQPSANSAGRRRHARRGAPAARGLWDYAKAELLGPTERGPRAGWGAGCGTPAEDGWPRLRAPAVRARPPAAAAVRPGYGQPPRGHRCRRTPARFWLARSAAAWEVHGRPQSPPAPG